MTDIPRQGIYWGVQSNSYPLQWESEDQEVISIWLMGFSYKQMLQLFPDFRIIQNVRNFIFPRSIGGCINLRVSLNNNKPRQLVDNEYINMVEKVGKPNGKLPRSIYQKYMNWVNHVNGSSPWWLKDETLKSSIKLKKLNRAKENLEKRIEKLTQEINMVKV